VRLARLRWQVEQDYRELKCALKLDHFEGRGFGGWSVAYGFLTLWQLLGRAAKCCWPVRPAPVRCVSVPRHGGYADDSMRTDPTESLEAGHHRYNPWERQILPLSTFTSFCYGARTKSVSA